MTHQKPLTLLRFFCGARRKAGVAAGEGVAPTVVATAVATAVKEELSFSDCPMKEAAEGQVSDQQLLGYSATCRCTEGY